MALRNNPRISNSMRRKILRLAKKQGYTPDPVVSTLMNQLRTPRHRRLSEKLAYLTFWPTAYGWRRTNINETRYFQGACDLAAARGYEVEHFWAKEPGLTGARLSKILYARGIRGVLLAPLQKGPGHVSLEWDRFACAAVSVTIPKTRIHRASHDYYHGMMMALRTLKHRGYRRIGFANSRRFSRRINHAWLSSFLTYQYHTPEDQRVPPLLVDGWVQASFGRWVEKHGLVEPARHKDETDWRRDEFARWLDRWRPDAIVSNTDHPWAFAQALGHKIPQDIGFVQLHKLFDDDPFAGIDRLPKLVGAATADLVIGQLQNNEIGLPAFSKTVLIEGVWSEGPSIRQAPSTGDGTSRSAALAAVPTWP